jgi:hypothetical protein
MVQLVLSFTHHCLKKALEMVSFGLQPCIISNKHIVVNKNSAGEIEGATS